MVTKKTTVADDGDEFEAQYEAAELAIRSSFPELKPTDPIKATYRMAERMLGGETLDDLFDATTGKTSDDLIGKAYEFLAVSWQAYEAERGVIPQAVCEVIDLATGEVTEFVTTATMLVMFLRRAEQIGRLPFKARIAGKRTKSGQTALNFERV